MKTTIRSLALFSAVSLWSGCADKESQPAEPPKPAAPSPLAAPSMPIEKKPTPPELATTAAAEPHSVADDPLVHQPEPPAVPDKGDDKGDKKDEPQAAQSAEVAPIDFDRELHPAEVKIDRFVLAEGVQGREPVGETDTFTTDTKEIFAFVQFANAEGAPYALRVHWEPVDGPSTPYGFKFEVPTAPRWRTWSWTRIRREPGHYRAVLRTLEGEEVASREFEIIKAE